MRVPLIEQANGTFVTTDLEDPFLVPSVQSATAFVAKDLQIPLVMQRGLYAPELPDPTAPIVIADRFARARVSVRIRPIANAPLELVDAGGYRVEQPDDTPQVIAERIVAYPQPVWPEAVDLQIEYTRGITADWQSLGAAQAMVVIVARGHYDGVAQVPSVERSAFERLAGPLRLATSLPAGARVLI